MLGNVYNSFVTLNVHCTVSDDSVDGHEYAVSSFCFPCNVGFFNTLRSDNLLLKVLPWFEFETLVNRG